MYQTSRVARLLDHTFSNVDRANFDFTPAMLNMTLVERRELERAEDRTYDQIERQ